MDRITIRLTAAALEAIDETTDDRSTWVRAAIDQKLHPNKCPALAQLYYFFLRHLNQFQGLGIVYAPAELALFEQLDRIFADDPVAKALTEMIMQ